MRQITFLHVGMHKTGTTFLQNHLFPRFRGITFLSQHANIDALLRADQTIPLVISNERLAGRLWCNLDHVEHCLQILSSYFPEARILMGFRPHADFIVSSYKQHLHQGGTLTFTDFFDALNDSGYMHYIDFHYKARAELVERYFGRPPFVILNSELRGDLRSFLQDVATLFQTPTPKPPQTDELKPENISVSYYQAKVLRWLNQFSRTDLNPNGRFKLYNPYTRSLQLHPRGIAQFWLRFLPDNSFFTDYQLKTVNHHFYDDWQYILQLWNRRMQIHCTDT